MENALVSVIIPTFNRAEMVCECINSILKSTYQNLEIIVVDNHSDDDTIEMLQTKYNKNDKIIVIALKENLMASGGRNEGIKHASGKYLLFVDNDNIVDERMIEILVNAMEEDISIGLVGPISINQRQGEAIWLASGDYNFFTPRPKTLFAGKRIDEVKLEKRYSTCYSPNVMMISRNAINKVGGFDKSYYAMYEEADIGYRILKAGFKEYIVTDARTFHMYFVNKGEQDRLRVEGIGFPLRAYHFAKNRSVFMKKYAKWYQLVVFYVFFFNIFVVYYTLLALRFKRKDIALAWLRGSFKGLFIKTEKIVKIEI